MKVLLLFLALSAAGSCSGAYQDWSDTDKKLWKSYMALNVIDTVQTFDLIDKQQDPNYLIKESNPILGSRPNKGQVVVLKLLFNSMAYRILDNNPEARTLTLAIMNGVYIKTTVNNHEVGLRFGVSF